MAVSVQLAPPLVDHATVADSAAPAGYDSTAIFNSSVGATIPLYEEFRSFPAQSSAHAAGVAPQAPSSNHPANRNPPVLL